MFQMISPHLFSCNSSDPPSTEIPLDTSTGTILAYYCTAGHRASTPHTRRYLPCTSLPASLVRTPGTMAPSNLWHIDTHSVECIFRRYDIRRCKLLRREEKKCKCDLLSMSDSCNKLHVQTTNIPIEPWRLLTSVAPFTLSVDLLPAWTTLVDEIVWVVVTRRLFSSLSQIVTDLIVGARARRGDRLQNRCRSILHANVTPAKLSCKWWSRRDIQSDCSIITICNMRYEIREEGAIVENSKSTVCAVD